MKLISNDAHVKNPLPGPPLFCVSGSNCTSSHGTCPSRPTTGKYAVTLKSRGAPTCGSRSCLGALTVGVPTSLRVIRTT